MLVAANDNEPIRLCPAGFGQRGFFVPAFRARRYDRSIVSVRAWQRT